MKSFMKTACEVLPQSRTVITILLANHHFDQEARTE